MRQMFELGADVVVLDAGLLALPNLLNIAVRSLGNDEAIEVALFFGGTGDVMEHLERAGTRFMNDAKFPPYFQFVLYPLLRALRRLSKDPTATATASYKCKWKCV